MHLPLIGVSVPYIIFIWNLQQVLIDICCNNSSTRGFSFPFIKGRNSEVTYMLSGNHKNKFSIDERSGLIRTRGSLDRERVASFNFFVTATDQGVPALQGSANVLIRIGDVNDNSPMFPNDTIYLLVTENNMPFNLIGKVTAIDADEGPNAVISYAFVQRSRQNWFQIDQRTGVVHTLNRFDREERSEYEVIVRASSGMLFSDARLVIRIEDVNDNAPRVPASQYIFYNFYEGYQGYNKIGKVGAIDKDSGDVLKFQLIRSTISSGMGERRRSGSSSGTVDSVGVSFTVDTTGTIYAYHQEPSSGFKPSIAHLTVNVSGNCLSNNDDRTIP